MVVLALGASALSAGEDSAPDASEKRSGSNGLRGVVKEGLRNGGAGVEDWFMKELDGFGDSKFAGIHVSWLLVNISGELTVVSLLWFKLRKWSVRICWTFGLPFPIHRALMRAPLISNIVEHIAGLFAITKQWQEGGEGKLKEGGK